MLAGKTVVAYAIANLGATLTSLVLSSWILYFYSPPAAEGTVLISAGLIGVIRIFERIVGAMIEPVIGHLSDKTNTRFGRRLPWIAIGAPLMSIAFALIWMPPEGLPTNHPRLVLHCAVLLILFWTAFTATVSPYLSLLPELGRDEPGRVRLSLWLAVSEVVANIVGSIGAGWLIGLGAMKILGLALPSGYAVMGVVVSVVALVCFLPILIFVREPPRSAAHEIHMSLFEAAKTSLKNPSFLPYAGAVAGYKMGTACAVIGVPFIATQLMGLKEEEAGYLQAVIIVFALLAFPLVQKWSAKHGAARVFRWGGLAFVAVLPLIGTIGLLPAIPPLFHGVALFVMAGFPVACVMVLPRALLADVIDRDTKTTGLRREAMYNGMSGVVEKAGDALSVGMVGVLFDAFGNSSARPLGLRLLGVGAAAGVIMGLASLARYQKLEAAES